MNTHIRKRARYGTVAALLLVGLYLVSCGSFEAPTASKKLVIHTSMDVYLLDVDSLTVEMGRSDTVYRFNDFGSMAVFVMERTKEEVSEQRAYWLELNRLYNER